MLFIFYKQSLVGVRGQGKNIITKHDPELSSRKNASTALDKFSLNLDTGKTLT